MSDITRINRLRDYIVAGGHRCFRQPDVSVDPSGYRSPADLRLRAALRLKAHLEAEKPVILDDENIVFTRTLKNSPDILSEAEHDAIWATHYIHEQGYVCNICPDYTMLMSKGFDAAIADAADDEPTVVTLEAIIDFSDRYRAEALRLGRNDIADVLANVPRRPASTLREALQFLRIIHFSLWCEGEYHMIFGRFDRMLQPYLEADIKAGRLDRDGALELVEDFFISCNKDSDLYPGMQQGDNGQSLVLGGRDGNGNDEYCLMSELAIEASLALKVIDPKINLRVDSKTPIERYKYATRLTAAGLGFPQYSNDDTVIEGLTRLGYSKTDAYNYVVAACWEFIIPGRGMDIPNIGALSFVGCVDRATREKLAGCADFGEYVCALKNEIETTAREMTKGFKNLFMRPAPLMSLMFELKEGSKDITDGSVYNNYGFHGTGLASAADYALGVKRVVFEEKKLDAKGLIAALDANFEGCDELRNELLSDKVKMGNDNDEADSVGSAFLAAFAEGLRGAKNERGGCFRAGTGSAMYYVFHANDIGAGADGRLKGGFLPANYSPSLGIKLDGPLSIVRSFTKPELADVINGGPLTLEFASSAIRDQAGVDKIALLVQSFVKLGGHQLQLNVIDKSKLIDAQKHPEKYKNLVVRVWGWSGYFVELDRCYQEQILRRADLTI